MLLSISFGLFLGISLLLIFEDRFVYYPHKFPQGIWEPDVYGLSPEDCFFTTSDGVRLHGWFFKVANAKATLLWCHGNAGNITHRLENIRLLQPLGINVFIFDYRGYGKSEGSPSEGGLYEDALAAYDYLIHEKTIDTASLIIFGRSIGTAVAVDLASKRPCRALVLESAFTSARAIAKVHFPVVHFFIRTRFDSAEKIKHVNVPILFVHGSSDRTIPIDLGKQLFEIANEPKSFYEISGADHNDTYVVGGEEYFKMVGMFIGRVLGKDK